MTIHTKAVICAASALMLIQPGGTPGLVGSSTVVAPGGSPATSGVLMASPLLDVAGEKAELVSLVQLYLTDQVSSVTESKTSNRSIGTNQVPLNRIVGQLSQTIRQEVPKIKDFRDRLRGTRAEHDWGKAHLLDPQVTIMGAVALMTVTEHSELHYQHSEDSTYYTVQHALGFVKHGSEWNIASDILLDVGNVDPSAYDRAAYQISSGIVSRASPDIGERLDPQGVETERSMLHRMGLVTHSTSLLAPAQGAATYNGDAAADYALKWTAPATVGSRVSPTRNPDYIAYKYDCTNFASQALRAGGWKDDQALGWYAKVPDSFFQSRAAELGPPVQSETGPAWRLADGLYGYGLHSSHRFRTVDPNKIKRGDLVFADWSKKDDSYGSDGAIDHAMIVTQVGDGVKPQTMRLTYHSSDQENVMLEETMAKQERGRDRKLMKFYYFNPVL